MADELDDCPPGTLAFWRSFATLTSNPELRETFALKLHRGGAAVLERYWEHGEGAAKVGWGTPGAMQRCIALNRDHMRDPGGYCAVRHKHVTGEWPTEHGKAGIPS